MIRTFPIYFAILLVDAEKRPRQIVSARDQHLLLRVVDQRNAEFDVVLGFIYGVTRSPKVKLQSLVNGADRITIAIDSVGVGET